ncbi:MAG: tyrosine-type recombinase/integrase [Arenimonas sp.]
MARQLDKLTALTIRNAKPKSKPYKLSDGGGLYLLVQTDGARYWRQKYRFGGVERAPFAHGVYPEVSLAEARERCNQARAMLRDGIDPAATRKANKEANKRDLHAAFPLVAKAWLAFKKSGWASETHRKAEYVVNEYLIPALRNRSIADLATKDVTKILTSIDQKAPNLAAKARQYIGGIVDYAIREGLREDGRLLSLKGTLLKAQKGHIPAATTVSDIVPLLKAIDAYDSMLIRTALKLTMLTVMRPSIIAAAPWAEIDLNAAEWHVPAARMKTKHAHIVSLPTQAVSMLRELHKLTGNTAYLFPALAKQKTPHISRDSLSAALRRMGFQGKHATHGFRGMFRTVARERLGIDSDILEAQLAHAKKGDVAKAYDRTTFGDARREAMQQWADYLDTLKHGGNVVPMKRKNDK